MKTIVAVVLLSFALCAAGAEESKNTVSGSRELNLQITSLPEAKLGFTQRFSFPFLQGSNPLTAENNIDLALTAEVTPISLNGLAEAVWTPIAFFQFTLGGSIGSGWAINLFGGDIYGIGITRSDAAGNVEHAGSAFDGVFLKGKTGATLQMDLAALVPGDWNHVIARTYHELNYKAYTAAEAGDSWYFENDDGENCNGFNYYGSLVVGYQMPIFLNMVALMAEGDLYLYDTPDRGNWGDDKIRWIFSAVLNFSITKQFSAALITQCRTRKNYLESNWEDLYYRNRHIDQSDPLHLEFYRVAAILTYRL